MRKKTKPIVSIIMNCHNGEKYLQKSLNSIFNQSYKNWELIFYNNKSKDKSKDIILSYKDKRIRYFETKSLLNLYKAKNLAVTKARGRFVCFLDTDDWWVKNKLELQITAFKKNKDYKFIFSNYYLYFQESGSKKIFFNNKINSGRITQFLLNDYKIGILSVMIEKKLLKKKKFNSTYNIIGDFDYFINLSLKEKFFCINKPLAFYRYHNNNYSKNTNLHFKEFDRWLKQNSNNFEKLGFKLKSLKILKFKLFVKGLIKNIGRVVQW